MSIKWFKGASGEAFPVLCGPDSINIPSIAGKLKLKPRSLELNGLLVDFNSAGNFSLAGTGDFLSGLGDSPGSAIPVSGQPAEAEERGAAGAAGEALPANWVDLGRSASSYGKSAKGLRHLKNDVAKKDGELRDHRPCSNYDTPLEVLNKSFGSFSYLLNMEPEPQDCTAAANLVYLCSQVLVDEIEELQRPLEEILQEHLGDDVKLTLGGRAQQVPYLTIEVDGHVVCMLEAKTDASANTRGQLQAYYVRHVGMCLETRQHAALVHNCMPVLTLEVNAATLRVGGIAYVDYRKFLCEPLTPAMHLYCINNKQHMLQLAKIMCAVRHTISALADEHKAAAVAAAKCHVTPTGKQQPDCAWPWVVRECFPGCRATQIQDRLAYIVRPQTQTTAAGGGGNGSSSSSSAQLQPPEEGWVVKLCQVHEPSQRGFDVHQEWAAAGVAPSVVTHLDAGGKWKACVMEHLALSQGWAPLKYYEHLSLQRLRQQPPDPMASTLPRPTTEEWQSIQLAVEQALAKGHATRLGGQPTVHGDARLANVLGKRQGDNNWDIRFLDFDWSGIEGEARYPVSISSKISWPSGVRARGPLQQEHDTQLLRAELTWVVKKLEAQVTAGIHAGKKSRIA